MFNWNPGADEIILVEGIFDALALIQNGFPHAVATFGTQGLKEQHQELIKNSRVKRIFMCYDGRQSRPVRSFARRCGLARCRKEVRIIQLPQDTDPNNFIMAQSREDFQGLIDSSLSPFDYELHQIDVEKTREDQLKRIRDDLLPRVNGADPIMQPELIKRIHEKFGVPLKALNEQLKRMKHEEESKPHQGEQLVEVGSLTTIQPALDMVSGTMIIMAPKRVIDSETQAPQWQNTIVTSNKERFVLTNEELLKGAGMRMRWNVPTFVWRKKDTHQRPLMAFYTGVYQPTCIKHTEIFAMSFGCTSTSATSAPMIFSLAGS